MCVQIVGARDVEGTPVGIARAQTNKCESKCEKGHQWGWLGSEDPE